MFRLQEPKAPNLTLQIKKPIKRNIQKNCIENLCYVQGANVTIFS